MCLTEKKRILNNEHCKMPRTEEDVKRLHKDYHILNAYIVKKYTLQDELEEVEVLLEEPLYEIAEFRLEEFLEELAQDFKEDVSGETFYITEAMVDEFVERYVPLALKELQCIREGQSCLSVKDYTWMKK